MAPFAGDDQQPRSGNVRGKAARVRFAGSNRITISDDPCLFFSSGRPQGLIPSHECGVIAFGQLRRSVGLRACELSAHANRNEPIRRDARDSPGA